MLMTLIIIQTAIPKLSIIHISILCDALKNEIVFLADYAIKDVCTYFQLREEELLCFRRKQSRPGHWI